MRLGFNLSPYVLKIGIKVALVIALITVAFSSFAAFNTVPRVQADVASCIKYGGTKEACTAADRATCVTSLQAGGMSTSGASDTCSSVFGPAPLCTFKNEPGCESAVTDPTNVAVTTGLGIKDPAACKAAGGSQSACAADDFAKCRALGGNQTACYALEVKDANGNPKGGDPGQAGGTLDPLFEKIADTIATIVYIFTVGLGSLIAYIATFFFNFAVYLSLNSVAYAMTFLTDGWKTVRDLANMMFIFVLIYIAYTIILRSDTNNTMKMLARVIAIALVINFSFFFVRVIIDMGNVLAVQFYNGINAPTLEASLASASASNNQNVQVAQTNDLQRGVQNAAGNIASLGIFSKNTKDLTAGIMGAINVQNLLNTESFKQFSLGLGSGPGATLTKLITLSFIYICIGIIFGMLAAAFLSVGVKFIVRIVVLWLTIIGAPLAFLLYAIPNDRAQDYAKQWFKALITFSMYPAVFLFLYYIITVFARDLAMNSNTCGGVQSASILQSAFCDINSSSATGISFIASVVGTIGVRLGFIMVLIYIALQISDSVSRSGGRWAQAITDKPYKFGDWLSRAGTIPQRLAGAAVTRPVGAAASKADTYLKNSAWANSKDWLSARSFLARGLQKSVLKPATNISVLGEKKYVDYKKSWDEEMNERAANRQKGVDRGVTDRVGAAIRANIAAGRPAETGISKQDLDAVQNIPESRLKDLSGSEIRSLAHVFTDGQAKVVDKLDKISQQDRETAKRNFDEHSPHSPLRNAKKSLEELRKLNARLGAAYKIAKVESTIGSEASPRTRQTIDSKAIKDMLESNDAGNEGVERMIAKVDNDIAQQSRLGNDTTALRQEKNNLQKASKALEKLAEDTKKIRAGVGDEADPGKFKS